MFIYTNNICLHWGPYPSKPFLHKYLSKWILINALILASITSTGRTIHAPTNLYVKKLLLWSPLNNNALSFNLGTLVLDTLILGKKKSVTIYPIYAPHNIMPQ